MTLTTPAVRPSATTPASAESRDRTRRRQVLVAAIPLIVVVAVIVTAPLLTSIDPNAQNLNALSQPPTWVGPHPLGTDDLGRDMLARVLHGGLPPLAIGVASVLAAVVIGVSLGLYAGFRGGAVDHALGRLADLQMSIPGLVLALFIITFVGNGLRDVIIVIALESWPLHFRIVRSLTQSLRAREFVEAAYLNGRGTLAILTRHMIPGIAPALAVTATINFVAAVLAEASLSFLGIGVQAPQSDWGLMISTGRTQIASAWWISVFPGIALCILLLVAQLFGNRLSALVSMEGRLS